MSPQSRAHEKHHYHSENCCSDNLLLPLCPVLNGFYTIHKMEHSVVSLFPDLCQAPGKKPLLCFVSQLPVQHPTWSRVCVMYREIRTCTKK